MRTVLQMFGNVLILMVAAFSVVYAGACVYAYLASDSIIFPAPPSSYSDGPDTLKLTSSDGEKLSAYLLEAANSDHVLLYNNGNGEDIGNARPLLNEFQKRGLSVLAYDYPGYGTSSGAATEDGVYAAAEAAYLYLTEEKGYQPEAIILYGRSLGGGPACWLAARYSVSGLILDGAFTSTFRVMTKIRLLPFDKFDNLAILPDISCPVLLTHGKQDMTVPFEHALKNKKTLGNQAETLWVDTAGHNDLIETAGETYWETVFRFIRNSTSTTQR